MGCDYQTWIETVIEYKDGNNMKTYIEKPSFDNYERHQDAQDASYDPDLEDPSDALQEQIAQYGTKDLYTHNEFVCKPAGMARIQDILSKQSIAIDSVTRIYKRLNGYWR